MVIKAALLDAPASSGKGVFVRMDELEDETGLTDRHVPELKACDLPPGRYAWITTDNKNNAYGGAFWPLDWLGRITPEQRAQLEHI